MRLRTLLALDAALLTIAEVALIGFGHAAAWWIVLAALTALVVLLAVAAAARLTGS